MQTSKLSHAFKLVLHTLLHIMLKIKMLELDNMLKRSVIAEMSDLKMIFTFKVSSFRIRSLLKFSWKVPKDKFQDQTTKLIYFDN